MGIAAPDAPEQLFERVQDLQDQLDQSPDAGTRRVADELVSAVVQMYGSGLERIFAGLADGGDVGGELAARLAEDPLIATLLLVHDLHPVRARAAGGRGTGQRAPVHGVPRRRRRAPLAPRGRGPDPPAGKLLGLLGVLGDARARDQAGPRGGRAGPRRARGRGCRPAVDLGHGTADVGRRDGRGAADRDVRPRRPPRGWSSTCAGSRPKGPSPR